MEQIFQSCGVLSSFLATFIEGEMLFLTAIISAKMGYFNFFWGLGAAFLGAYTRDFILFFIAKKKGAQLLNKKPKLKTKIDNASERFEKKPFFYLTIYRLTYTFNSVIVILSGVKNVSFVRFAIPIALSVRIWVALIGSFGYFCAEFMIEKLNLISENKFVIIGSLAVLGLAYWFFFKRPHDKDCYVEKKDNEILKSS